MSEFISARLTLYGSVDSFLEILILIGLLGSVMQVGGRTEMEKSCRIEGYQSV